MVIINDGSTDNSGDILEAFKNDNRITIINKTNGGLSSARNKGLEKIYGKFVTFVDSDDLLAPNAIDNWLDAAFKYDADVVEGSFQRRTEDGELLENNKYSSEISNDISKMYGTACFKIYKAKLWENTAFPVGYWYEDTIICGIIQPKVEKYIRVPDIVYYYTKNKRSISYNSLGKPKILDNFYITRSVLKDAHELDLIKVKPGQYFKFFLNQIHTNWYRTFTLGADCEYTIFVETCKLYNQYLREYSIYNNQSPIMVESLSKFDFDKYRYSNFIEF